MTRHLRTASPQGAQPYATGLEVSPSKSPKETRSNKALKRLLAALTASALCLGAQASESVYVETVSCVGGRFGLKLPVDARALKSMAPLLRTTVLEVERWDGYTATRKTLFFEGLELGVVEFSNEPQRLMLTHADLTHAKWNHLSPFKLGQPTSAARQVLGAVAKQDIPLKQVYASEGDSVQFRTSGAKLIGVSYHCYSG